MMAAVHLGLHDATRTRVLTAADLPAAVVLQRQVERDLPAGFLRGKPHLTPQFRKDLVPVATDKSSSSLQTKEHSA